MFKQFICSAPLQSLWIREYLKLLLLGCNIWTIIPVKYRIVSLDPFKISIMVSRLEPLARGPITLSGHVLSEFFSTSTGEIRMSEHMVPNDMSRVIWCDLRHNIL